MLESILEVLFSEKNLTKAQKYGTIKIYKIRSRLRIQIVGHYDYDNDCYSKVDVVVYPNLIVDNKGEPYLRFRLIDVINTNENCFASMDYCVL